MHVHPAWPKARLEYKNLAVLGRSAEVGKKGLRLQGSVKRWGTQNGHLMVASCGRSSAWGAKACHNTSASQVSAPSGIGSGSSEAYWGDPSFGGSGNTSWYSVRSIHQQSHSTESLNRTIAFSASGQAASSGSNLRTASASGAADSSYHSQWEDH